VNKKYLFALILFPIILFIWNIIYFSLREQPFFSGYFASIQFTLGARFIIILLVIDFLVSLKSKHKLTEFFKLAFISMIGFVVTSSIIVFLIFIFYPKGQALF
jgi:hypothetical protein